VAGHHSITKGPLVLDPEPRRLMTDELIYFLEGALVEKSVQALTRSQLSLFVLTGDGALTARMQGLLAQLPESLDPRLGPQDSSVISRFDSSGDEMATPYLQFWEDEVSSTQDLARARLDSLPVVVTARRQSEGRGRIGAVWETAPRALAVSVAFRIPDDDQRPFSSMAGVAAARAIAGLTLKWPNDLIMGGGKAGGILVERASGVVMAGMGVNLWWPDPPDGVSALRDSDPGEDAHSQIAGIWAAELLAQVAGEGWPLDEYRGLCETLGREITWEPDGAGRAVDIDPAGGLVVEIKGRREVVTSGVVRHVRG
jgi:BirA family biotin operon repressor/biotin-[acetyl-CoA-carboxylase] ligase